MSCCAAAVGLHFELSCVYMHTCIILRALATDSYVPPFWVPFHTEAVKCCHNNLVLQHFGASTIHRFILHSEDDFAFERVLIGVQQLAEVARGSVGAVEAPPMEKLLACVRNIRQVAQLLQQPGRRFKGPHGHEAAAVCIQAHWR